jgi:pyrimidine operon attenuation protein/uracil phosphoribosyltransferase
MTTPTFHPTPSASPTLGAAPEAPAVGLMLDAESLYADLLRAVRPLVTADTAIVGIWSGGVWLAERLHRDLGQPGAAGVISSALHRDDFHSRGMAAGSDPTKLPFEVDNRPLLLVDDVLNTGRTIRAVVNELFDFGRPSRVQLAVLVDRGGRELPIAADVSAARVHLPADQRLSLTRSEDGRLHFAVHHQPALPAGGRR